MRSSGQASADSSRCSFKGAVLGGPSVRRASVCGSLLGPSAGSASAGSAGSVVVCLVRVSLGGTLALLSCGRSAQTLRFHLVGGRVAPCTGFRPSMGVVGVVLATMGVDGVVFRA